MRHVRISLGVLALGITLLARTRVAGYCACKAEPTVAEALAQSESVFVGSVSGIGIDHAKQQRVTTFRVARIFKGASTGTLRVTSTLECDYPFARDSTYLVFASSRNGRLFTSFCSGNLPVAPGSPLPPALGTGRAPASSER